MSNRTNLQALLVTLSLLISLPVTASQYWSTVSPLPGKLKINSLIFDGAKSIAVGERGAILVNTNGTDWVAQQSGLTTDLSDILFTGSRYIAIGWGGTLLSSVDNLATWQVKTTGTNDRLRGIAFNGTRLVAIADNGVILTSDDNGDSWTKRNSDTGFALRDIIWDGSKFIIVSGSYTYKATPNGPVTPTGLIMISIDNGLTWNNKNYQGNAPFHSITAGNGLLVIAGDLGSLFWSNNDGIDWNAASTNVFVADLHGVTYGNGQFLAVGETFLFTDQGVTQNVSTILNSTDGKDWTRSTLGASDVTLPVSNTTLHAAAWDDFNNQFIVVGTDVIIAADDTTLSWANQSNILNDPLSGIATSGSTSLAVSSSGAVYSSNDGLDWALLTTSGYSFNDITWDGGQYVAIAGGNTIITSLDGMVWAPQNTTGLGSGLKGVAYNSVTNTYVAIGTNTLVTSTNLTSSWISPISISGNLTGITWNANADNGAGEFLVVSDNSQVLLGSANGQTWTALKVDYPSSKSQTLPPMYGVAWNGSQYVAVGDAGQVAYSNGPQLDRISWQGATPPDGWQPLRGINWHSGQGRFIAVGDNSTIITSAGADLDVFGSANSSIATENAPFTLTFFIKNNSVFHAQDVKLTLYLPSNLLELESEFGSNPGCNQSGQTLNCSLVDLPAIASTTINIKVIPLSPLVHTDLITMATVSAVGPEALPHNNRFTTSNYVQSLEDKIWADFNNSSGGSGSLNSWLILILAASLLLLRSRFRLYPSGH